MSQSKEAINNFDNENLCVVCCKNVEIYSVGLCDHPVCFECSTRMRVLCNQNECPICRGQMPKVIFSKEIMSFMSLFSNYQNTSLQDRQYGLIFCSDDIKKAYQKLMEQRCTICTNAAAKKCTFLSFQHLKDHLRREHSLAYCDLCVENLKIFCYERRCYTKQELGYHRRKGDPDNTSHRGHPLCEFCDTRFMDSDELYRHLRRQHLFCHYCDADGKHQYYNTLFDICRHFRNEHYLCEEGECSNIPLTAVFRTDIDLKAHIATAHGRYLSKSANKQARTLELEFTLAPRPGLERNKRPTSRIERFEDEGAVGYDTEPGGPGGEIKQGHSLTSQDFPALGNSVTVQNRPLTTINFTSKTNSFNSDDFPSLSGPRTPAVTITTDSSRKKGPDVTITRTLRGNSGGSTANLKKNTENFPYLGKTGTSTVHLSLNNGQTSAPNVSIHVNHNGATTTTRITSSSHSNNSNNVQKTEAFPALGQAVPSSSPQWVQQKSRKHQEPKINKVAPPPQLPPSDLSQFPTLNRSKQSNTKKSSVTVSMGGTVSKDTKEAKDTKPNNNNNSKKNKNLEATSSKVDKNEKTKKVKKKNGTIGEGEAEKNGIVKKRSEMNFTLKETTNPPPGFSVKPPPGFNAQNFPNLGGSNDLTFTSSSGRSYSITPANYHQPTNFPFRNQNLIKRSLSILNESVQEFKTYSAQFRDGKINPEVYYEYCKASLNDSFCDLFPELLVLLPDIEKQQELFTVCEEKIKKNLVSCMNCHQVIFARELPEHYTYHTLDSQFPSLGKHTDTRNVWKK